MSDCKILKRYLKLGNYNSDNAHCLIDDKMCYLLEIESS